MVPRMIPRLQFATGFFATSVSQWSLPSKQKAIVISVKDFATASDARTWIC